ncbi:hypothetical protein L861_16875 [Litchfieldella anticariensis FP35 = DSM 16096]|uniref:Uncharacterized protein n=1 Tax=Litchfieldella anticariensis (strain DSM 16096 / CECT 5854 / CIP 108499 / LMG 22089 / FP35) TaxID=1121939 RepID=S2KHU4_LITA3|nr:hypothetical protein [Halomonas anticariensis]EPC01545.1 hypothetical protein L861_16875 [Halomonas anticariensis FP35 = DSM 16096]
MNTQHITEIGRFHLGVVRASWTGRTIITARREPDEGPMSVEQAANARREAEYVARRNGIKEPLLQIWKISS